MTDMDEFRKYELTCDETGTTVAKRLTAHVAIVAIVVVIIAAAMAGCAPFQGKRTSKIELNILGNTWKSETTLDGEYNPSGAPAQVKTETPLAK